MAKRKPEIRLRSYGIYERWDSQEKALPKIKEFTLNVPAVVDIEFGLIVNIKGAKNQQLDFCIDHPWHVERKLFDFCLLYTSPSPRD